MGVGQSTKAPYMAISRDASNSTDNGPGFSSMSMTFSHTCAAGAALYVGVTMSGADVITGVTYNAVAMTQVRKIQIPADRWTYLYALGNPATGANNIVVSCSTNQVIIAASSSYLGTNNSTTVDSNNTGSNSAVTSQTLSTNTVADNCWLIGWHNQNSGNLASASTNTSIVKNTFPNAGAEAAFIDSNSAQTPAGSKSLAMTWTGSTVTAMIIASIAPQRINC